MRYALSIALAAFLGLALANPVAAQERGRSSDDSSDDDTRVIVRGGGDNDDRDDRRGRTTTERGRDGDDRARGRTGSERGRDVEESRRSGTLEDIFGTTRRGDDRRQPRRGDDDWDDDDWGDDDWDDDDRWDDRRRGKRRNAGNAGPPFCRNGQGHPVHGREWCRDKGFGGGGYGYDDIIWDRRDTRGIYFPTRRGDRYMSGSILQDILGNVIYNRLGSHARERRMSGPIRGRFDGPQELRIYAGRDPIARLIDSNRDGIADVVYFRR